MPKKLTKSKNLYYRRAQWTGQTESLESALIRAHALLQTRGDRSFLTSKGHELIGAQFRQDNNGIFLQIASSIPDQPTSTIDKDRDADHATISAEPAPDGKDFLDGDIFVMVKDNHVLLCPSGLREGGATYYFSRVLRSVIDQAQADSLELCKIADAIQIAMINNEGVKELRLCSSLYHASQIQTDHAQNSASGFLASISNQFKQIFSKDPELRNISSLENINVQVSFKFDGTEIRKKGKPQEFGESGKQRLLRTAELMLNDEDEEDSFIIITGQNNEIRSGEIRVTETATIRTLGKSLSYDDAWRKLLEFYLKLRTNGVLAQ